MYILNKIGPKTDPCGTPCSNSDEELKERLTLVLRQRSDKYLTNLCKTRRHVIWLFWIFW